MLPRATLLGRVCAIGFSLIAVAQAGAQLASKSPFMPPQGAAASGPTPGAPLEFRGYMSTSEGMLFRIHDPAKKTGAWVKLNERNADFDVTVKQHSEDHGTVTIEHQGKTLTLAVREPKVVSAGSAGQVMPPPPVQPAAPANVPPAVTQAVVLNPTPADEQRRLEAVAAEVARRRALREQAAQNINQGTQQQQQQQGAAPQTAAPQPQINLQQQPPQYGQPVRGVPSTRQQR